MEEIKIKLKYRADRRLSLVEVRSGKVAFLVSLMTFEALTGVDTSDIEWRAGEVSINSLDYKILYSQREKGE